MHGAAPAEQPGRYWPQITIMREMRWSWADLMDAPADLIDEVLLHITYERRWEHKRAEIDKQKAKR